MREIFSAYIDSEEIFKMMQDLCIDWDVAEKLFGDYIDPWIEKILDDFDL